MGQFIFRMSEAKIITRYFHTFSDVKLTLTKCNFYNQEISCTSFDDFQFMLSVLNIVRNSILIFEVYDCLYGVIFVIH